MTDEKFLQLINDLSEDQKNVLIKDLTLASECKKYLPMFHDFKTYILSIVNNVHLQSYKDSEYHIGATYWINMGNKEKQMSFKIEVSGHYFDFNIYAIDEMLDTGEGHIITFVEKNFKLDGVKHLQKSLSDAKRQIAAAINFISTL